MRKSKKKQIKTSYQEILTIAIYIISFITFVLFLYLLSKFILIDYIDRMVTMNKHYEQVYGQELSFKSRKSRYCTANPRLCLPGGDWIGNSVFKI